MVLTEMMLLILVDEINTISLKKNYGDETYRKEKCFFKLIPDGLNHQIDI
jgi:hypothetical protein